jgi:carboxypeptidase family protein
MIRLSPKLCAFALALFSPVTFNLVGPGGSSASTRGPDCQEVDGAIINITRPVLSGTVQVGSTLTVTNGTWSRTGLTYSYTWFRDDGEIIGAIASSYVLTNDDKGSVIYAHVHVHKTCVGTGDADSNMVQVPDDGDEMGPLESDQATAVADDDTTTPAAPQPMTPTGPAPPGSYTTDTWDGDATDTNDGLNVVSSTASGTTALTGYVEDDNSGSPVPGASVSMSYRPCPTCDPVTTSTTSDAAGSYAFLNMPAPQIYTLTIAAMGFGTYMITNDSYAADETYEQTAALTASSQTYDATPEDTPDSGLTPDVSPPGTAYSQRRVPPSIIVQMYRLWPHNSGHTYCTRVDPSESPPNRNWSLPFYVLHVTNSEIGFFGPNQTLTQAFMSAVQNFAWFHKTLAGPFDVTDAADIYAGQCFQAKEKIPRARYYAWLALLRAVSKNRIVDGSGNLRETPHRSGKDPGFCNAPPDVWAAHGGTASQYGMLAHSLPTEPGGNAHCPITDWKTLALYYYPTNWSVVSGKRPPPPTTSFTRDSNTSITFHYHSLVYGRNVAWSFALQRKLTDGWHTFKRTKWVPADRAVRDYYTLSGLPATCVKYRVFAANPVDGSLPSSFNGGVAINPNGNPC